MPTAKWTDGILKANEIRVEPIPDAWIRDITNRVYAEPDGAHLADILGLNTEQDTTT